MKIEDAIKQKKFINEWIKADVNIMFTASWLGRIKVEVLKPYGISFQQFNILRILKGMNPKPATVKLLTERMVDRMSNASRLVDKLVQKGLVKRKSSQKDLRKVDVFITKEGERVLSKASKELEVTVKENLNLTKEEAHLLNGLLDKLRTN